MWKIRIENFFDTPVQTDHLQKGTRYYTECGEVTDDKKFGVVSYVLVGGPKFFCIFPHLGLKCEHFLKQIFG